MATVSTITRAPCCSRARFELWRSPIVRDDHRALCGIHPARLEPGHPPIPELHELRPPMAGRVGLGRQSWQDALGIGRMRAQRHRSIAPQMGRGAVQDRASRRRGILVSTGLGLRAPGVGRLLRAGRWGLLANRMRRLLADRLMALFSATETKDWVWFEDLLAYDNARLPQALIQTGLTTQTPAYVEVGLRSLRWLMSLQTTSSGYFRPVGTKSFGRAPPETRSVRSAASRGVGNDFCLPCRVAGGGRRGVAGTGQCARSAGSWAKTTCKRH